MSLNLLVVQLLNGTQLGVLLFLVAAGLTLVFGVMNFINLAHGVQFMLGAYLASSFGLWTGRFWFGLLLALPASLAVGMAFEFLVFRHLYQRDHLSQVLATFGVILTLEEAVRALWGVAPLDVLQPEGLGGFRIAFHQGHFLFRKEPFQQLAEEAIGVGSELGGFEDRAVPGGDG